jgi:hypothetical protein
LIQEVIASVSEVSATPELSDLSQCPAQLLALDPNAERLWQVFLRKTGIALSQDGKRVLDNEGKRARVIRRFGIPSLASRLEFANAEISRARIWWREATACSEGEGIPDLTRENGYVLNPFIVTPELKFERPAPKPKMWLGETVADEPAAGNSIRIRRPKKHASNAAKQQAYRQRKNGLPKMRYEIQRVRERDALANVTA